MPPKRPWKIACQVFLIVLLLLAVILFWLRRDYQNFLTRSVIADGTVVIEIEKGDTFKRITQKLLDKHVAIEPHWFRYLAHQKQLAHKLKTGEFELHAGLTAPQILDILVLGRTRQYAITFPEGWNFRQMMQAIEKSPYLVHSLSGLKPEAIMVKIDPQQKHPEGWFFPDTYYFEKNMTDLSLLKRAYGRMRRVLKQEWENRSDDVFLQTPYQALILASIVEKETGQASERPVIAGVFSRRLRKGMLLQSDPTIIYGMGDNYQGNIRRRDIHAATPYNTYVIKGLPPTPIAMPGQQAIHAVLHPEKGHSLYFVARGDGSHVFSDTLTGHNRAVDRFQRKKR